MPLPHDPELEREFLARVEKTDECWNWVGHVDHEGYAEIKFRGRTYRAHRLAYQWWVGSVREDGLVRQACGNRRCPNPAHLEQLTALEHVKLGNNASAVNARKTHCKHGHEFTPANTYWRRTGGRGCKQCRALSTREGQRDRRRRGLWWRASEPAGSGRCQYCGRHQEKLEWDHVVMRSVIGLPERHHPDNLVRACHDCNTARGAGQRPRWDSLPVASQRFVLEHKGAAFAERYFRGFTDPE